MGYIFQLQILFCYNFSAQKKKKKTTTTTKNIANFDIEGTISLLDTCSLLTAYLLLLLAQFVFIIIYRECPYFLEIFLSSWAYCVYYHYCWLNFQLFIIIYGLILTAMKFSLWFFRFFIFLKQVWSNFFCSELI